VEVAHGCSTSLLCAFKGGEEARVRGWRRGQAARRGHGERRAAGGRYEMSLRWGPPVGERERGEGHLGRPCLLGRKTGGPTERAGLEVNGPAGGKEKGKG
jgi:hypothetical protein